MLVPGPDDVPSALHGAAPPAFNYEEHGMASSEVPHRRPSVDPDAGAGWNVDISTLLGDTQEACPVAFGCVRMIRATKDKHYGDPGTRQNSQNGV